MVNNASLRRHLGLLDGSLGDRGNSREDRTHISGGGVNEHEVNKRWWMMTIERGNRNMRRMRRRWWHFQDAVGEFIAIMIAFVFCVGVIYGLIAIEEWFRHG